MKEIIIDKNNMSPYGINADKVAWSLISSEADGNKQLLYTTTCRDYMNDFIIGHYNKIENNNWSKKSAPLDETELRLLIARSFGNTDVEGARAVFERELRKAVKVLNLLEKTAGWQERSKLHKARYLEERRNLDTVGTHYYMLIGPREWIHSTHLLSMATLIIRVITTYGFPKKAGEIRSIKTVEKHFAQLCNKKDLDPDLNEYLPATYMKFRKIMKNYSRLFGNFTPQECNPPHMAKNWHGAGGIFNFCMADNSIDMRKCYDIVKRVKEVLG